MIHDVSYGNANEQCDPGEPYTAHYSRNVGNLPQEPESH
jgi:hypothetical protein